MILEWGLPPQNTDKLARAQSGINLVDGSYQIEDEPSSYLIRDELSGGQLPNQG